MIAQPDGVRRTHRFQLLGAGRQFNVEADLEYRRDQPYTVTATFRTGPDGGVQWLFARDLLIEGMFRPAGLGDIRIMPHESDPDVVVIELRSPDGHAVLAAPAGSLADFLSATYLVVGVGMEHETIGIDEELAALANGAL